MVPPPLEVEAVNKKKIGLIVMALVLCALVATFLLINGRYNESESTDTGKQNTVHTVNKIDASSIKEISYTNGGGEYTFTLDGSEWKYARDEKFPLDTKSVSELAEALSEISADKVIEGKSTDSAEYGLDTPAHTVRVTCTNGAEHTYKIGDYNRHSGLYYLAYDKSDKVYMVSSSFASVFTLEEEDFLVLEKIDSITADSVSEITAQGTFGKITLTVSEQDGKKIYTHTNAEGGEQTLDAEGAVKIIKALCAPALTKCADYCAEGEELDSFGLGESERVAVTVSYTAKLTSTTAGGGAQVVEQKKSCTYYIGEATVEVEGKDGEEPEQVEKTYLVLDNSSMVFDVDMSGADAFFEK